MRRRTNLMIRTIKYRGLIKYLSRGGVNPNASCADKPTKCSLLMAVHYKARTSFDRYYYLVVSLSFYIATSRAQSAGDKPVTVLEFQLVCIAL